MFRFSKTAKALLVTLLVFMVRGGLVAQTYGNEWISYSQQYFKIPVAQTGIYRIDQAALAPVLLSAGVSLNTIDPRRFQVFYHGQQIPLFVNGESDGNFGTNDYIEFFAEPNNGWLDTALYVNPYFDQPNPAYSLYSDTSYYFLTWNSSLSNLRYIAETDTSFASYSSAAYYYYVAEQGYSSTYYEGQIFSSGQLSVEYTRGEGYGLITNGAYTLAPDWNSAPLAGLRTTTYTGGPQATLNLNLVTANDPNGATIGNPFGLDHHHQVTVGGVLMTDTSMSGHDLFKRFYTASASSLSSVANPFEVDFLTNYSTNTKNGVMYWKLRLPQTFNLGNRNQQFLYLPDASAQTKSRLNITSFNNSGLPVILYDLTNKKRITVALNGSTLRALVPNSGGEKKLYISSSSSSVIHNITQSEIKPVSTDPGNYARFYDYRNQLKDFNYIIIYPGQLKDGAITYNAYRNQTGFHSVAIDFSELQDQFGFGVPKHPMAIRNFLRMGVNTWNTKPEHVFILGKGIKPTFTRTNTTNYDNSLIPAIGVPSVDNLYGFNLRGTLSQDVMVGRVAATNEQQLTEYYNKVRDYEANLPAEWMKNILHLGGGFSYNEQQQIAGYMNGYAAVIEDSLFGGNVTSFFKQTSQPYPITVASTIDSIINVEGVSLITIFGHGSGQGFDQNLEDPENMYNTAKYPFVMAYSCLSGDLFQTTPLIGERYVLQDNKGAIGFISSTSLSFPGYLDRFADSIYANISLNEYGKPIGTAMRRAITSTINNEVYQSLFRMTGLDMQLHGDPGLKFNSFLRPDIELLVENVSFDPPVVTSEADTFYIQIVVNNLGRAITTPYGLTVTRNFPVTGFPDTTYYVSRPSLYYKDTVRIGMPVDIIKSFGDNYFTIVADQLNQYVELSELNNQITVKLNIASSDIIPVYPFKYQVVPRDTITVKAVTGDPFAPLRTYRIEIDTTDLFNSPFKRDTTISQIGGVVKWHLPFQLDAFQPDSAVFFWRAGVDSANTGNFYHWKESSFQYIPGKYGWGQDHFFQFKDDRYVYIDDNRTTRTFDFVPNFKELKCTTRPCGTSGDPNNFNTRYLIDGVVQEESAGTPAPSMIVAVIDPITLQPWESNFSGNNPSHDFDNGLYRNRDEKYFVFTLSDPVQRDGLMNMLNNSVPNGYHVLAYTWFGGTFNNASQWNVGLVNAFVNMGCDTIQTLVDSAWSRPLIFYTRKGVPGSSIQIVGTSNCENIEMTTILQNDWIFGTITSEIIGPASQWKSFHWRTHSLDANPNNDQGYVNIIGITASGQETILYNQIPPTSTDTLNLASVIDANIYPYMKLFMYTRDDSTTTPLQIDHWHVMYEGVPEAALNPSISYSFYGDSLSVGEELKFSCAVENIGDYDMDSLWIRYFVIDKNNQTHNFYVKKDSLRTGEFIVDTFRINTSPYSGLNSLWIEANPLNHPQHQLEQYHFNNIGSKIFNVGGDKINPILDVTFDGIHIMDGDIVSAKPEIKIQLKDENQYLLLDDTSDFELYLKYPNQSTAQKLNFGQQEIAFYPATGPDNTCYIEYTPDFSVQDGVYELLIRAQDKSNNISGVGTGDYDYSIKFEVINQSTVTNVLNYPNPFSTQTQFVFTLTGSELPTEFTIQILTISGVVVREITMNELGPVHIGRNITDYRWDGRDEYGDLLATGVYLYRVIAKMNGEDIHRSSTSADKYFKNGFGKMYIMR